MAVVGGVVGDVVGISVGDALNNTIPTAPKAAEGDSAIILVRSSFPVLLSAMRAKLRLQVRASWQILSQE